MTKGQRSMKAANHASLLPEPPNGFRILRVGEQKEIGDLFWVDYTAFGTSLRKEPGWATISAMGSGLDRRVRSGERVARLFRGVACNDD